MQTKMKIIESALKYFANKGYEGASMSEIAKETGITKSSIYGYFSGKQKLYLEVLEYLLTFQKKYWKRIEKNFMVQIDKDSLKQVYLSACDTAKNQQDMSIFWKKCLISPPEELEEIVSAKVKKSQENIMNILMYYFKMAQKQNMVSEKYSSDYLALTFLSLIGSASLETNYTLAPEKDELKDTMFEIFWAGIEKESKGSRTSKYEDHARW